MEFQKNKNSKVNLNHLYSQKEIEDIKNIIPKINDLITINSCFSNNKSEKNSSNQTYVDKNEFIELILEKTKMKFKEENNIVLSKSISFILKEIQKMSNETKKHKNNKLSKLTNKKNSTNLEYNMKLNERNLLSNKNGPNKNPFYTKIKSAWDFSSHSNSKKLSYECFPYSIKKQKNSRYINNTINNTVNDSINKKYLDVWFENDDKIKNLKGDSIINNFITFSNNSQTMNTSSNSNIKLNKEITLEDLNISNNNNIYNPSRISKFCSFHQAAKKYKSLLVNKIQNQISNINNTKVKISLNNNKTKFTNTEKTLNHLKNNLTEFELQNHYNTNKNYKTNRIKKIEKLKTENIFDNKNKNYNKKSIKKTNQPIAILKKNLLKKDIMHINNQIIENKDFDIFEFDNKVGKENTLLSIGNYIFIKYSF
jgi:hypothetical protein